MNSYIYEMDVTRLRCSYILPDELVCTQVMTIMKNNFPFDGSNIEMKYQAIIRDIPSQLENGLDDTFRTYKLLEGESLQEVVEECRQYVMWYKLAQVNDKVQERIKKQARIRGKATS